MWNSRPDADLVTDLHPYRRMMLHLMPGKYESVFYFAQDFDVSKTLDFVADFNDRHREWRITPFHVLLWATVRTLNERPMMNRFISNGKAWQRRGIWASYVVKKEMSDEGGAATMKRQFDPSLSFEEFVAKMYGDIRVGRSDERTHVDKEMDFFLKLPGPVLRVGVKLIRFADALGLLPRSFVDPDPMFCSVFIANLGSLKMKAGFHHLFEYGNCPIFGTIGQIEDTVMVRDGKPAVVKTLSVRWTFDERIADGYYAQTALERLRSTVEDPIGAGIEKADRTLTT